MSSTTPIALEHIPVDQLQPSPTNPRKTFDEVKLAELATSIAQHGVLEPILVRPIPPKYPVRGGKEVRPQWDRGEATHEVVAGERRYRASQLAKLEKVPCLIRELSDREVLEIQVIENLQRDDLHPLEEADGYSRLIKTAGYDVEEIAERIGRSQKYVYDRVKLLQLVPELRTVFLDGEITAGHAILLARLESTAQQRALDGKSNGYNVGGLFQHDHGRDDEDQLAIEVDGLSDEEFDALEAVEARRSRKAVSVRELARWIDDNVRFRPEAEDLPNLFPETKEALATAEEEDLKVIHITRDYQLRPETRAAGRTYSRRSWKRADGGPDNDGWGAPEPSKECDHRVMGVVVAGPGRGEAFYVCVAKKKCAVHWSAEQKQAEKRAKGGSSGASDDKWREQQRRQQEDWKRQDAERERWRKAGPKLTAAVQDKIADAKLDPLIDYVLGRELNGRKLPKGIKKPKTAAELVRVLGFLSMRSTIESTWLASTEVPKALRVLGINAKKIVDEVAPKPKDKKPAKKGSKKKAATRKGAGVKRRKRAQTSAAKGAVADA